MIDRIIVAIALSTIISVFNSFYDYCVNLRIKIMENAWNTFVADITCKVQSTFSTGVKPVVQFSSCSTSMLFRWYKLQKAAVAI